MTRYLGRRLSLRLLIVAGFISSIVAFCHWEPISKAIQIGPDEDFEVMKAMLWSEGFTLYDEVWNDQPPLLTVLLGVLFKFFSPSICAARTLSFCFGLVLVAGCFLIARQRFGLLAACISSFSLITAPTVFELCVTSMLEVPAIGTAVFGLWQVIKTERPKAFRLLVAGALIGISMQIKLTAVILIPVIASEILLKFTSKKEGFCNVLSCFFVWITSAAVTFIALGMILGSGYEQAWSSHFSKGTLSANDAQVRRFSIQLLLEHPEALLGGLAGCAYALYCREWRRVGFALVFLATSLIVHCFHHPWWPYYYLHIAIPFALLSGYGIAGFFSIATRAGAETTSYCQAVFKVISVTAALLLSSQLLCYGGIRVSSEIERIESLPQINDDLLIKEMRKYRGLTRFVYAQDTIYPFHAQLLVLPELAVLPIKRLWSGQMSHEEISSILKVRRPEQILLRATLDEEGSNFVKLNYKTVYTDGIHQLYILNEILATSPETAKGR